MVWVGNRMSWERVQSIIMVQKRALCSSRAQTLIGRELVVRGETKTQKSEKSEKGRKKYTETVLLPRTQFPLRLSGRKRVEMDEYLYKNRGFSELYRWQRENLEGPEFVLHDGPPYANGTLHMGHAINKILKDITLRNKVVEGRRVHYVPGWDCHGLPIELKILDHIDSTDPIKIRREARKYAEEAIIKQRRGFQSWGLTADWQESGCYFTNRSSYVKNQLHQFISLYEKGLVFRDFKPVHWSPSSRTALAESELEYDKNHGSKCAVVRLRLDVIPAKLKPFGDRTMYALTWTTTPWTLVANRALAFSVEATYCLAESVENNLYLIGERLLKDTELKIGPLKPLITILGKELTGSTYFSLFGEERLPFLPGQHVTQTLGTGLVHTAPAHGPEDFLVALENNLKVVSVVDVDGRYNEVAGPDFYGLEVLQDGTERVLNRLAREVLHVETLTHSYPYDWRTKKPVLIRASEQWFIDINAIKQQAFDSVANIEIYPKTNRAAFANILLAQIQQRPYWCISRQRSWGTPIPVLSSKNSGTASTSRKLVERLCSSIDRYGPDCWWELSADRLVGLDVIHELGMDKDDVEKGQDIMDIWFDSGISWSAVLPQGTADLYLEGLDQFTGWFQSSLLTSVALRGHPPYRALFVHGFAVDEKASKMSKSMGNVVNPDQIVKGGSDLKKSPAYGVDVLRWWVASHGCQHTQVPVTKALLDGCAQSVQKLRATLRFLLGVSYPYHSNVDGVALQYRTIDKYMLYSMYRYNEQVQKHYNNYEYHHACKEIMHFVANDVSSLYCHLVKDRLYCDGALSPSRLAAVRVATELSTVLARSIAPILPHLAEEMWLYHPENLDKETVVPLNRIRYKLPKAWNEPTIVQRMDAALRVRNELNKIVDGNTWLLSATVEATTDDFATLSILHGEGQLSTSELCEILQVSWITLIKNERLGSTRIETKSIDKALCERCRRFPETEDNGLCGRCAVVVAEMESASVAP